MPQRPLFTIGYEGSAIDDFASTLRRAAVEVLIDVRDVPISRKKGFSKNALRTKLEEVGIAYLHLKGLGDPKPGRTAAKEGRFDDFRRIFSMHLRSEAAQNDLLVATTTANQSFVCLLCFERDHRNCHRCMVAEEMAGRGAYQLTHLGVQPSIIRHDTVGVRPNNAGPFAGTAPIVR